MSHDPIFLNNLSVSFPSKICFEDFSATIYAGDRIALIGHNGSGKTSLLKILANTEGIRVGYVPQLLTDEVLSGGQRFNAALTEELGKQPDLLLLDEPTNHLDRKNRQSLIRMLQHFPGTLVIASHDVELLRTCVDIFWHFDNGQIHVFTGNYDDYIKDIQQKRVSIEAELSRLDRQKKDTHQALMKEQERSSKSKTHGEKKYADDKMALRSAQGQGQMTTNKNRKKIADKKGELLEQLGHLHLPEIISPKFSLAAEDVGQRMIVEIRDGSCGYCHPREELCSESRIHKGSTMDPRLREDDLLAHTVCNNISLTLSSKDRLTITGDNGSGKSTLVKAIMGDSKVWRTGEWFVPKAGEIGYLDQHYDNLHAQNCHSRESGNDRTVLDTISCIVPHWSHAEVRKHLNDFLFRKNEEVNAPISTLSGGEKARLSLAQIAAKTPKLLILDEVTNNLDLETRNHVIQVLKNYPGTLIVISHDNDFLEQIGITHYYST